MINYSKTIVFYNIFFTYMVPYTVTPANATRLGLTAQQVADLTSMKVAWDAAFEAYINPATYGRMTIATINSLWADYKIFNDGIAQQLKSNPSLTLTEFEYILFNIHKDATRRRKIPAATAQAGVSIKIASHLNNEYHAFDIVDPTKSGKPKDVTTIKVKLLVLPQDAPMPVLSQLVAWDEVGTMNFDIPFTETQEGKVAYVVVCFSNDAGDAPYSEIVGNIIS